MKYTSQEKEKNFKNSKKKSKKSDNIIDKINSHSDSKFKEISKFLNNNKNYTIEFTDKELNLLSDKTKILSATFNFYGIIRPDGRFMWAYMIPGIDKRIIKNINRIKEFSYLFENSNDKTMMLYHQILTQDSILLDSKEILLLNKLILYLSDDLYFFNTPNKSNNIQIIYITKINEKYI